jgi:hypothetical protein
MIVKRLWRMVCRLVRPLRFVEVRLAHGPCAVAGRATFFVVARGYGTLGLLHHTIDVDGAFSGIITVPLTGARARVEARGAWWRQHHECNVVPIAVAPIPPLLALSLPSVCAPSAPAVILPDVSVHLEVP